MLKSDQCDKKHKILVVDKDERYIKQIKHFLGDAFSLIFVDNPQLAIDIIQQDQEELALALIDQRMYRVGNKDLFCLVSEHAPFCVRIITSDVADTDLLVDCINKMEVYHYLLKPYQADDLMHSIYNALFYRERILERRDLIKNLKELLFSTIESICGALEAKDKYTIGHSRRVTLYSLLIGRELGLSKSDLQKLHLAGLLHDIGKIAVPEDILNKPGRLTEEEFEVIKQHPAKGADILRNLKQLDGMVHWVIAHHERYDGKGYPHQLKGDQIPLGAAILAVADTYDAMTSDRAYRKGLSHEIALEEIKKCTGSQFNPEVTKAYLVVEKEIEAFMNDKELDVQQDVSVLLEETELVMQQICIAS